MTFDKINRRVHLYLGLALAPWLLMYGVSSFIVIHQTWFKMARERKWDLLFEKPYSRPLKSQGVNNEPDLRTEAQAILKDCDMEGAFWVDKPKPDVIHIDRFNFWNSTSLTYSIKDQKLKAERMRMRLRETIVRLHFRGGYHQNGFWNTFWGLVVDIACIGIIIWVASGLVMWWRLRFLRTWGAVAIAAGIFSFVLLVWKL
jgi:hypothetical protein